MTRDSRYDNPIQGSLLGGELAPNEERQRIRVEIKELLLAARTVSARNNTPRIQRQAYNANRQEAAALVACADDLIRQLLTTDELRMDEVEVRDRIVEIRIALKNEVREEQTQLRAQTLGSGAVRAGFDDKPYHGAKDAAKAAAHDY